MKSRLRVALLLALALTASSCLSLSQTRQAAEKALEAIHETRSLAREFLYRETTDAGKVEVKGVFEDDLRFAFIVAHDSVGQFEAVVSDDTVAVRLLDPAVIPPDVSIPDPSAQALIDELRTGAWVVDPAGAPTLDFVLAADVSGPDIGKNPIRDALSVFPYVLLALREAGSVREWNKDDTQPAYRGVENDFFEDPSESLGVSRFDLVRPPLPRREGTNTEANEPRIFHFRKIALYVRDGAIVKIKEEIEFENHIQMRRAKEEGQPKFLLDMLDRLKSGDTETEIRPRQMTFEITPLPSAKVVIPQGTSADLAMAVSFIFGQGAAEVPGQPTGGVEPPTQGEGEPPPAEAATPPPAG